MFEKWHKDIGLEYESDRFRSNGIAMGWCFWNCLNELSFWMQLGSLTYCILKKSFVHFRTFWIRMKIFIRFFPALFSIPKSHCKMEIIEKIRIFQVVSWTPSKGENFKHYFEKIIVFIIAMISLIGVFLFNDII